MPARYARGDGGHGDDARDEGRQVVGGAAGDDPAEHEPEHHGEQHGHERDVDELFGIATHLYEGAPCQRRDLGERVRVRD